MSCLNDLTLEQKGELMRLARLRDKQRVTWTNSKMAQFYFNIDRQEAERLCLDLGLYAWGCNDAIKKKR